MARRRNRHESMLELGGSFLGADFGGRIGHTHVGAVSCEGAERKERKTEKYKYKYKYT